MTAEVQGGKSGAARRDAGHGLAGFLRRGVWGIADQGLISATNFLTMVLVARSIGASAFGEFALVYSALLLANIFQNTLITWPHNVLAATRQHAEYRRYTTSVAVGQLCMSAVLGALALAAAACGAAWHLPESPLLWALAPAIFCWQSQEFVRRVLYTELRPGAAFFNDCIAYGLQGLVVAFLWHIGRLDGAMALYTLAGTSAFALLVGLWQIRTALCRHVHFGAWKENWAFGKYLAGAELIGWCSSLPMYLFIAGFVLGAAAAAQLKVSQVMYGPMRVVAYFLGTVLPTQFARAFTRSGKEALAAQLRKICAVAIPLLTFYCLFVAFNATWLLHLVYGPNRYEGDGPVLAMYSAVALLTCLQMLFTAAISAMNRTRHIFRGNVLGGLVSFLCSWPLIYFLGVPGALVGMIASNLVVLGFFALTCAESLQADRIPDLTPSSVEVAYAS